MNLLSARQKLVASNIANVETPGYKTKELPRAAPRRGGTKRRRAENPRSNGHPPARRGSHQPGCVRQRRESEARCGHQTAAAIDRFPEGRTRAAHSAFSDTMGRSKTWGAGWLTKTPMKRFGFRSTVCGAGALSRPALIDSSCNRPVPRPSG